MISMNTDFLAYFPLWCSTIDLPAEGVAAACETKHLSLRLSVVELRCFKEIGTWYGEHLCRLSSLCRIANQPVEGVIASIWCWSRILIYTLKNELLKVLLRDPTEAAWWRWAFWLLEWYLNQCSGGKNGCVGVLPPNQSVFTPFPPSVLSTSHGGLALRPHQLCDSRLSLYFCLFLSPTLVHALLSLQEVA